MIRFFTVIGARPQFVKAAVLSRRLRAAEFAGLEEALVHTGQHYDPEMSQVFLDDLGIPAPAHYLGVGSGSHAVQTGKIMAGLEALVTRARPDAILVYGDTNSTLAAALVAAKAAIPLAHVEAGLRSYRRGMPEEINRVVTDRLSDLLFCPTATAVENLAREGRTDALLVGDIMYDGFRHEIEKAVADAPQRFGLVSGGYVLATVHRAENTDDAGLLSAIVQGLGQVARTLPVLLPLHPRTRAAIGRAGLTLPAGVVAVPPQPYHMLLGLLSGAAVVATDSGGLQKEAAFVCVPCVTLRGETEWRETVESGWNRLAPLTTEGISDAILASRVRPSSPPPDYGDGDAAGHILNAMRERLGG